MLKDLSKVCGLPIPHLESEINRLNISLPFSEKSLMNFLQNSNMGVNIVYNSRLYLEANSGYTFIRKAIYRTQRRYELSLYDWIF